MAIDIKWKRNIESLAKFVMENPDKDTNAAKITIEGLLWDALTESWTPHSPWYTHSKEVERQVDEISRRYGIMWVVVQISRKDGSARILQMNDTYTSQAKQSVAFSNDPNGNPYMDDGRKMFRYSARPYSVALQEWPGLK